MRAGAFLLVPLLLLAGCATPEPGAGDPSPTPSTATTPPSAVTTPATVTSPAPTTPSSPTTPSTPPQEQVVLGVVLDETHSFTPGGPRTSTFNVTGGEQRVVIDVTSSGPPADGSFQSAVVHFYFPNTTSPFVAELPGQQAREFTIQQQPHRGMWKVVYDGTGQVTVGVRVTLQ